MIKVIYNRREHSLSMSGHGQTAEYGYDLLCAGASTLCYALANAVEYFAERGMKARHIVSPGSAEISCVADDAHEREVEVAFDSICGGFAILVEQYPQNISYEVRG